MPGETHNMNEKDLIIKEFSNSTAEVNMKITHIPTGTVVSGTGERRYALRRQLLKEVEEKINE